MSPGHGVGEAGKPGVERGRWRLVALLIVCAAGVVFNIWAACALFEPGGAWKGHNDFLGFYAGARLSGSPALYDYEAIRREQVHASGTFIDLQFTRLPAYALLLKPITWLPYRAAYVAWLLIQASAFAAFAILWPARSAGAKFAVCCWLLPAFVCLFNGQDVLLTLFWLAIAMWLNRRGKPFAAGMALAMCASKYHLFLLAPVAVVAQRRWRMFGGAIAGGAGLLAISFLAQGPGWLRPYLAALSDSRMNPNLAIMPNLHPLFGDGPVSIVLEAAAAVVLAVALFLVARRSIGLEAVLAGSIAASLLVSFHSYMADCAILLPALTMAVASRSRLMKALAVVLALPAPWFWLHLPPALPGVTRVLLIAFTAGLIALGLTARDGLDSLAIKSPAVD